MKLKLKYKYFALIALMWGATLLRPAHAASNKPAPAPVTVQTLSYEQEEENPVINDKVLNQLVLNDTERQAWHAAVRSKINEDSNEEHINLAVIETLTEKEHIRKQLVDGPLESVPIEDFITSKFVSQEVDFFSDLLGKEDLEV